MEIEHIIGRTKALLDGVECYLNPFELMELKKINFVLDYVAFMLDYDRGKATLRSSRWKVDIIAPMFDCLDSKKLSQLFIQLHNQVGLTLIGDSAAQDIKNSINNFFALIKSAIDSSSGIYDYIETHFRLISFNRFNLDFAAGEYVKKLKLKFYEIFQKNNISNKIMVVGLNFKAKFIPNVSPDFQRLSGSSRISEIKNCFNFANQFLKNRIIEKYSVSFLGGYFCPHIITSALVASDYYVFFEADERNLLSIYQFMENELITSFYQQNSQALQLYGIDSVRLNNTIFNHLGLVEIDDLDDFLFARIVPSQFLQSLHPFCWSIYQDLISLISYPVHSQSMTSTVFDEPAVEDLTSQISYPPLSQSMTFTVFDEASVKGLRQIRSLKLSNYINDLDQIYSAFNAILIPLNNFHRIDLDITILIKLVCFFIPVCDLRIDKYHQILLNLIKSLSERLRFDTRNILPVYATFFANLQQFLNSQKIITSPQLFFLNFVITRYRSQNTLSMAPMLDTSLVSREICQNFQECNKFSVEHKSLELNWGVDFFRDSYTHKLYCSSFENFFNNKQKMVRSSINRWTEYLDAALIKDRIFVEVFFNIAWSGSIRNRDEVIADSFELLRKMLHKVGQKTISAHFGFCDTTTSYYFQPTGSVVSGTNNPDASINFKFLLILIDVSNLSDLASKFDAAYQSTKTKTKLDFDFSCQFPYACVITKKLMPSLRVKITNYVIVGAHINDFSSFLMSYKGRKIIVGHPKTKAKPKSKMQN